MNTQAGINIYDLIQQQFDGECDNIQLQTEKLLNLVPKHDLPRRKKILDLHKLKLKEALLKLDNDLKSL
jgi:hypothetical protein